MLGTPGDDDIPTGIDFVHGNAGADTVRGGDGSDQVDTGGGAPDGVREEAYGGAGANELDAGTADELLVGGRGRDTVEFSTTRRDCEGGGPPAGVAVDLALSGPQDTGGAGVVERCE